MLVNPVSSPFWIISSTFWMGSFIGLRPDRDFADCDDAGNAQKPMQHRFSDLLVRSGFVGSVDHTVIVKLARTTVELKCAADTVGVPSFECACRGGFVK